MIHIRNERRDINTDLTDFIRISDKMNLILITFTT